MEVERIEELDSTIKGSDYETDVLDVLQLGDRIFRCLLSIRSLLLRSFTIRSLLTLSHSLILKNDWQIIF